MNRKDVTPESEIVAPSRTGHKATAIMTIQVMVEVNETDDWNDMVNQAKDQLRKRVIEGKGFVPFRSTCETIHNDVEVEELKYHTIIEQRGKW